MPRLGALCCITNSHDLGAPCDENTGSQFRVSNIPLRGLIEPVQRNNGIEFIQMVEPNKKQAIIVHVGGVRFKINFPIKRKRIIKKQGIVIQLNTDGSITFTPGIKHIDFHSNK